MYRISMAEPGTFWKVLVISLIDRRANFWASWNSILSIETLNSDIGGLQIIGVQKEACLMYDKPH